jgi:membrane-associated phospholipid phosphatase
MAAVYLVWIGLVPASLAIALVWTRRSTAGAWYVTAISIDWLLGVVLYYAVPSLGPVYSSPGWFADLPRTPNTAVNELLLDDRVKVLAGPWDTGSVQTIAAFASLHVAVMVTICLVAEAMRLPVVIRVAAWAFLALTMVATVYLGWHFFVDVLAGIVVGAAAFALGARATGNPLRRREEPWTFRAALDASDRSERDTIGSGCG